MRRRRYAFSALHHHLRTTMITITGALLSAFGLVAALLLMASPLALDSGITAGAVLWVLFPLFTALGWTLMVMGSRDRTVRLPTQLVAGALLVMALVAAGALVLAAANVFTAQAGTAAWWYVMAIGGIAGVIGMAAYGRRGDD